MFHKVNDTENEKRPLSAEAEQEPLTHVASKTKDSPQSSEPQGIIDSFTTSEPISLIPEIKAEDYPLDVIPDTVRNAISEAHKYIQAPLPLVASSAFSAMSLAIQGHIDVQRANNLQSPTSLFLLTVAESGERKSTCDKLFTKAISKQENLMQIEAKKRYAKYKTEHEAWTTEKKKLLAGNEPEEKSDCSGSSSSGDVCNKKLEELSLREPQKPNTPRLILNDETPEHLLKSLAEYYPSSGLISSEGGQILGSASMNADNIMKNLSQLNLLWDGSDISKGTMLNGHMKTKGARLTVAIQVQQAVFDMFNESSGDLSRGSGFMARYLICNPESTQGNRMFVEPPSEMTHIKTFNNRITDILNEPLPYEDQELKPKVIKLAPDAKVYWVDFYNGIEKGLIQGGEYSDVRDVANKTADNAVRLSGLFHYFENISSDEIPLEHLKAGCGIALWYLKEAQRFFKRIIFTEDIRVALILEKWLIAKYKDSGNEEFKKSDLQKKAPTKIRGAEPLNLAIKTLVEHNRVTVRKEGQSQYITLHPLLL